MDWVQALALGVVQGLTEFLPISSTAHVFIFSKIFGWGDPGAAFSAIIQIGTELAVVIYFRKDIADVFRNLLKALSDKQFRKSDDAKTSVALIIGSLPILVIGFALRDLIETDVRNLHLVATMLIVFGVILLLVDRYSRPRDTQDLTYKASMLIGLSQALALVPGVSRSGATISAGLALGYSRNQSTRFAFLLAIPAVFASGLFELRHGFDGEFSWGTTLLATIVSFCVGMLVIRWFMRFISKYSFSIFGWYRIILGISILLALSSGLLA
jgi:undecaprenyl-diphosphatase